MVSIERISIARKSFWKVCPLLRPWQPKQCQEKPPYTTPQPDIWLILAIPE
jgi:hypothetical protein